MAHNLDITNGRAAFVSAREDAWHRLGTVLDDAFTAEQAMEQGLLGGWNVRALPVEATDDSGEVLAVTDRRAIVRTNPVNQQAEYLGTVGNAYHIIQNEEHAELLNAIVDESGAHFETAGAINGGRQVFITMKLPGHMNIGGVDQVDQYLAAMNSHDGSTPFTLMTTPVRVVCENTLNMALQGVGNGAYRVRHTSGAERFIRGQAREALDLSFKYLDGFQEMAEQLINTEMSQTRFEEIIRKEFGAPEDASPHMVTRSAARQDEFAQLFADAHTHEAVRNTAWAGFNALTEWYDHQSPTRGAADESTRRAVRSLLEPEFKTKALQLMMAG